MSGNELAYMTDDFDLPRWHQHDPLSSSAQAAHAAQQSVYTGGTNSYSQGPPPPPQSHSSATSRQPPIINTHHPLAGQGDSQPASARNPRLSHFFDDSQNQYLTTNHVNLSRSQSLGAPAGGAAGTTSIGSSGLTARRNRHPMPDDLESAYMEDSMHGNTPDRHQQHRSLGTSQQISQSFYPPSVSYATPQQTQLSGHSVNSTGTGAMVGDMYTDQYTSSTGQSRRQAGPVKIEELSPTNRSPRRTQTGQDQAQMMDPYAQIQQITSHTPSSTAYSPTSTVYPYPGSSEMTSASPYQSSARQQQTPIKIAETAASPLASPYTGQRALPPHPQQQASSHHYNAYMDASSPGPSHTSSQHYTSQQSMPLRQTMSTPNTPLGYVHGQNQMQQAQYGSVDDTSMYVDSSAHKRRPSGFKRVHDHRDLRPYVNTQPPGRRQDANGQFLSPLRQLTTNITDTYHICNPLFRYESASNPRRVLTKPSKPMHNEGYDNEDYDYILYVNDWLGNDQNKYLILDVLGQGTFGQVVKCQNMKTHEIVAVKVVKNKPAYFNQSMMEVTILELLNGQCDPQDEHHILRLKDSFIHKNHLCLVFELLSSNLYELIKQNQFQGLSTQLVKVFTAQLLDALSILKDARLIHCDLKPENILLKSLQSPTIKVIDFGSACHERQTVYTYIQSRFYRSPEVLLGIPYNAAIDMWSLGCIAVELFLGLPLFPGTSEFNQITRIVEMLGMPPTYMLEIGKQAGNFFDTYADHYGQKKYRLKSLEQYSRERNVNEQPGKQYFKASTLPDIINSAPMPTYKNASKAGHEMEKEIMNRAAFIDFCQGLLNLDPIQRWTPQQARMHPFITGEKYSKPFVPPAHLSNAGAIQQQAATADPKRPYGGLVPSQPQGKRAYQDAASYNQHLAQHQAYTAQQQAAAQAASSVYRNPYVTQQAQQANTSSRPPDVQHYNQQSSGHGPIGSSNMPIPATTQPNPPSTAYYPNSRTRSNTVNVVDAIPPALARLQHMNNDVITGRNALTPVLNRDDAMREWERRQAGKAAAVQPYPQLEYLEQQAQLAAAAGLSSWNQPRNAHRFQAQPSSLSQSFQPSMDDGSSERREAIMNSVRNAARTDQSASSLYNSATAALPSPPQAYAGASAPASARFANSYSQSQSQSNSASQSSAPATAFDSIDRGRGDMNIYVPMQPDQYHSATYNQAHAASPGVASEQRNAMQGTNAAPSFYGGGVVSSGGVPNTTQRNPFTGVTAQGQRSNGMENWPR